MIEPNKTLDAIYTFDGPEESWRRANSAYNRHWLVSRALTVATWLLVYAIGGGLCFGFGWYFGGADLSAGMAWAALGNIILVALYWLNTGGRRSEEALKKVSQETYTCRLTDETWSFTLRNGVTKAIPWKLIKIVWEHPEAWMIRYGDEYLFVFREPLRAAGLEDEFYLRVAWNPGTNS